LLVKWPKYSGAKNRQTLDYKATEAACCFSLFRPHAHNYVFVIAVDVHDSRDDNKRDVSEDVAAGETE